MRVRVIALCLALALLALAWPTHGAAASVSNDDGSQAVANPADIPYCAPDAAVDAAAAPEAAAPEAPAAVPETATPEAPAAVAEAAAPAEAAPAAEAVAPEVPAPEAVAPEAVAPETAAPEPVAPEAVATEAAAPATAEVPAEAVPAPEVAPEVAPATDAVRLIAPDTDPTVVPDFVEPGAAHEPVAEVVAPEPAAAAVAPAVSDDGVRLVAPDTDPTVVPDYVAPEAVAPEAVAPETVAPEAAAPAPAPEVAVDAAVAPEIAPEVAPEVAREVAPEVAPEADPTSGEPVRLIAPDTDPTVVPDYVAPQAAAPEAIAPDAAAVAPEVIAPEPIAPEPIAPEPIAPEAAAPAAVAPEAAAALSHAKDSAKASAAADPNTPFDEEYHAARPGKRTGSRKRVEKTGPTSGGTVGGQEILYPDPTNFACSNIDWRKHVTLNPTVRSQDCSNCWLLSAVQLVEHFYASYSANANTKFAYADGHHMPATDERLRANYPVLSTQQIADCASSISAQGTSCQTGSPAFALDYIMSHGIMGADNYTAFKESNPPLPGETCPSNMVTGKYNIEGFSSLYETCLESSNTVQLDCEEFAAREILIAHQLREMPLLVSVDASTWTQPAVARLIENETAKAAARNDGTVAIFDRVNLRCSSSAARQTHSMMLVGLEFSKQQGWFWVLKNTWGPQWGDKGYIYLRYGENTCGLANAPLYVNPPPTKKQRLNRKEFATAFAHERIPAFHSNKPILPRDSSIYVSPSSVWSPSTLCQSSPFSKFDLAGLTKFLYPGDNGLFASFQAAKTRTSTVGRTFLQTGAEATHESTSARVQSRMRQRAQAAALEPLGLEPLHQWQEDSLLEVSAGGAPEGYSLSCFESTVTSATRAQVLSALNKKVDSKFFRIVYNFLHKEKPVTSAKRIKSLTELRISEAVHWTMELFAEAGCKSFNSLIAYHALLRMDPTGAHTGRGTAQWYPFCSDAKWQQLKDFCKMSVDAFVTQILEADSLATGLPEAAQAVADANRAAFVETESTVAAVSVQAEPLSEEAAAAGADSDMAWSS